MDRLERGLDLNPHWIQPKTPRRDFELHAGSFVLGTLRFERASGSLAIGTTADGSWSFKRIGFFKPRVTVRKSGEDTDCGIFVPTWSGSSGSLQLTNGRLYHWRAANIWASRYEFFDAMNRPIVVFRSGLEETKLSDLLKMQSRIEVAIEGRACQDLSLLLLFGWYLMILAFDDNAATSVAVVG
jgi:hypothetical protein